MMTKLNRTKIKVRGPKELPANSFIQEPLTYTVKEKVDGILKDVVKHTTRAKLVIGFAGIKGYRLHPTKGWKKEAGFIPSR